MWKKDLRKLFTRKSFGEGSSPALHGDTVVVIRDHEEEDALLAFDKNDGRELWRTRRLEPTSWSTPLIVEHGGPAQVLVAGSSGLRGYDLKDKDGRELWSAPELLAGKDIFIRGHKHLYRIAGDQAVHRSTLEPAIP